MKIQNYLSTLKTVYNPGTNNHEQHNSNPKYWQVLLGEILKNPKQYENLTALDFGCGKGRNVSNLLSLANWKRVDGIDISEDNINFCKNNYNQNSNFILNNGINLVDLPSNEYSFVMSTIVFQHLCSRELRLSIKKEIYRVMKLGGLFSFQMGFGSNCDHFKEYYDDFYEAPSSNGGFDVTIRDPQNLIDDLTEIGFKNISYEIHESWQDGGHPNWIYVKCYK